MAGRPLKKGLDYAEWDSNIFEDPKIWKLIAAQGIASFTVYFYLCLRAFNENGYFLCWGNDQCAIVAKELGKGASAQYVRSCVEKCLHLELFDKELFELHGILTSRGIQKRFWRIKKTRARAEIPKEYWLLEKEDFSSGFVSCAQKSILPTQKRISPPENSIMTLGNSIMTPQNPILDGHNAISPTGNSGIEKETENREEKRSKKEENKEKENYSLSLARPRGKHQNVMLTDEEYKDITIRIPDADAYIDSFSAKLHDRGYTYADHYATILAWWKSDKKRRRPHKKAQASSGGSFDTNEFFNRAVEHSRRKEGEENGP